MLRLVTPPAADFVSIEEGRAQLNIDDTFDDFRVGGLIKVACGEVERHVQRRYVTQTLEWVLPRFGSCMKLPVAPVASVTWVKYVDLNGDQQTLTRGVDYLVRGAGQGHVIRPLLGRCWPCVHPDAEEPVVIRFVAGAAAAAAPPAAKQAALLMLGHLNENREAVVVENGSVTVTDLPRGFDDLLISETWS